MGVATYSLFLVQLSSLHDQSTSASNKSKLFHFLLLYSSQYFIMYLLFLLAPEKVRKEFLLQGELDQNIFGNSSYRTFLKVATRPKLQPLISKLKRLLLNAEWQFFTLNAGKLLLLLACHFMFPTAVVLETRNVMHYNVQILNRKRKQSLFQCIIIVSESQEYCCEHTFWYS